MQKGPFSLGSRTPRLELARRAAELERASAGLAAREQFIGPKFQSSRRAFSSGGAARVWPAAAAAVDAPS
jgi:hypothetical protein